MSTKPTIAADLPSGWWERIEAAALELPGLDQQAEAAIRQMQVSGEKAA